MDQETVYIIRKAQSGNTEAFHRLVTQYDGEVMTLALKLLSNPQDAEDVYQDVFLKVYKHIKQFRFESEFSTWIYRITMNTIFNYKKRMKHQSGRFIHNEEGVDQWLPSPNNSYPEGRDELQKNIMTAVNNLPQKQRTVFIMKHLEQLKISDIAAILNCSEGTIKKYLFRAMEKLRKELIEYHYA